MTTFKNLKQHCHKQAKIPVEMQYFLEKYQEESKEKLECLKNSCIKFSNSLNEFQLLAIEFLLKK